MSGRILRTLRGTRLWCGCLSGTYETYGGDVVTLIDERGRGCPVPAHRYGRRVEVPGTAPSPVREPAPDLSSAGS